MQTDEAQDELPDYEKPVTAWERSLRDWGEKNPARMDQVRVLTLFHGKQACNPEHEYLVIEVFHPSYKSRYLTIERYRGTLINKGNSTSSQSSLPASSTSSKTHEAIDCVQLCTGAPPAEEVIRKVSVRKCDIRLVDVAIAARVVHDFKDQYKVFKTQCFWFCDMVFSCLHGFFNMNATDGWKGELTHIGDSEDQIGEKWQVEVFSKKGGTWRSIYIHRAKPEKIDKVIEAYKAAREKFRQEVQFLFHILGSMV